MNARLFKIFVGSPTDTQKERDIVDDVFAQINETLGKERNIRIESFKWEKNVIPDVAKRPQDVILKQGEGFDIFIGFMWQKYGTKGSNGMSPSEEEFDIALKSYLQGGKCKRILYYFNNEAINPEDIDPEQIKLVREFQNKISEKGVEYKKYKGVDDFKNILHVTLYTALVEILDKEKMTVNRVVVHKGLRGNRVLDFDKNTKLLYDSLLMSPRVGKIKIAFVESYVQLFLYDHKNSSVKEICDYLDETFQHHDRKFYENVISTMKRNGVIDGSKQFYLTETVEKAVKAIVVHAETNENMLLKECEGICRKYDISLDATNLYNHITRLFDQCYNVDDKLEEEQANKQQIQGKVIDQLVDYIAHETNLPIELSIKIANEFVKVCCDNPMFDKCSTSKMFLNLFKQDKLEQYMSQTTRHLFLDTQVLLQIVCALYANDSIGLDGFYVDGRLFWNSVKNNNLTCLYTTNCYVDELVGNMIEAQRVALLLRFDLQDLFGESNNVFLRDYLRLKKKGILSTIEEYFSDMLGINEDEVASDGFHDLAYDAVLEYFETLGIGVVDVPFFEKYEDYRAEYQKALYLAGYEKKDQTLINDLNIILYMSDFAKDKHQTPYLVSRDNSFAKIRKRMLDRFPELSFWYIHAPLRVANMLSVMTLRLNPAVINRNIVSIVEKSFDTNNYNESFLDVMANYVDKSVLNDWEFAKKMKNLKKSLEDNSELEENMTVDVRPSIESFFNYLFKRYSKSDNDMKALAGLFTNNDYSDRIETSVKSSIAGFKGDSVDNPIVNKCFDELVHLYQSAN